MTMQNEEEDEEPEHRHLQLPSKINNSTIRRPFSNFNIIRKTGHRHLLLDADHSTHYVCLCMACNALASFCRALSEKEEEENNGNAKNKIVRSIWMAMICLLLQSPWASFCETGCLFLRAMMIDHQQLRASVKNDTISTTTIRILVNQCQPILTRMLTFTPPPMCLWTDYVHMERSEILKDDETVRRVCDGILVNALETVVAAGNGNNERDYEVAVDRSIKLWSDVFQHEGIDMIPLKKCEGAVHHDNPKKITITTTTMSMRLMSSMAGALVAIMGSLPFKKYQWTPLVRALMTSAKNETSKGRTEVTCRDLVRLLHILSPPSPTTSHFNDNGDDVNNKGKVGSSSLANRSRTREKIMDNICSIASLPTNFPLPPNMTRSGCHAARTVLRLVISQLPSNMTLEDEITRPLWQYLTPLTCTDDMYCYDSVVAPHIVLLQSTTLLVSIASSFRQKSQTLTHVGTTLLSTTTRVTCTHPDLNVKTHAMMAIVKICQIDTNAMVPYVLPCLLQHLSNKENSLRRLNACRLLYSLVESVGVSLCPFVRYLLPVAMSMMTDNSENCANLAAAMFAVLVRMAPLVSPTRNENCDDEEDSTASDCFKSAPREHFAWAASEKVIDHLIHGYPLPPCRLPESIVRSLESCGMSLRAYQKEGVAWMEFLRNVNLNGALCDDMGLGKTLQSLIGIAMAHLCSTTTEEGQLCNNNQRPKSLIICPSSVEGHWMSEISKVFPNGGPVRFKSCLLTGSPKWRRSFWETTLVDVDVVVTSYPVLRSDIEYLTKVPWTYCILDEGHLLKNPKTVTAKAAQRLHSRHKMILTGTPVQNNVNELWAVFHFLMPNYLGSEQDFARKFATPIQKGQAPGASAQHIFLGMESLKLLHQQVLPFLLRREKKKVLDELPPKTVMDIPCRLTIEQARLYHRFCRGNEAKAALAVVESYVDNNGTMTGKTLSNAEYTMTSDGLPLANMEGGDPSSGHDVLKSLFYLRLICTHPALVPSGRIMEKIGKEISCNISCADHETYYGTEDDDGIECASSYARFDCSGKLAVLNDLLRMMKIVPDELTAADNDDSLLYVRGRGAFDNPPKESSDINDFFNSLRGEEEDPLGEGEAINDGRGCDTMAAISSNSKCLIFAQFAQSLKVVEELLFRNHMPSMRYVRLDGRVNPRHRHDIIHQFNTDDSIKCMLLTTKVGGLGLNLQAADVVIFLECDWNPHADIQAMDRAHRLGQKKSVMVYRLITAGTIEEKIMKVQQVKHDIYNSIVNSENSTMFSMGTDRLLDLFTMNDTSNEMNYKKKVEGLSNTVHTIDEICNDLDYSYSSIEKCVTGV